MGRLEDAVDWWFSSRGLRSLGRDELPDLNDEPDMAFEGPDGLVFVVLLDSRAVVDRRRFMDSVMKASALRCECELLYVAVPKEAAPFVDTEVLRKRSTGLLVVGEEGVLEALPSPRKPRRRAGPMGGELIEELLDRVAVLEDRLPALESQLRAIRPLLNEVSSLRELREAVRSLSYKLDSLSRRVDALSSSALTVPQAPGTPSMPPPAPIPVEQEGLPSFFKDNPWLEILARRGRDELPA